MILTKEEKSWVTKMNALAAKCPSDRLGFLCTGDPCVDIYDKTLVDANNIEGDLVSVAQHADAMANYRIWFPSQIHAVCG